MAKSMIKKARTAAQKAATKKWQIAGAAKRKALAGKGPGAAANRRLNKVYGAMRKAGYGKGKDPFGTPASVKIARFNKANAIYSKMMKKK